MRFVFAVCLFAAATAAEAAAPVLPGPVPAEVVRVIDGDTVEVEATIWLGQRLRTQVRLWGVDAPELKGRCAAERRLAARARAYTAAALAGGRVALHDVRHDKYGRRVLARLVTDQGRDLGRALIAAGLARPYQGERRGGWCDG
jgi:endonuclease YncB( thermonuclease family)